LQPRWDRYAKDLGVTLRKTMKVKELIDYDILEGIFFILKNNIRYRKIFPNEEGYIIFYKQSKRIKLKANKVAIELVQNIIVPKDKVVLHKNLNETDYRYCNLKLISKKIHNTIKESYRNLNGYLKLQPHPKDMFSYVLVWKENGKDKILVVQDIVVAKRMLQKLQLKYAKILNRYCVFD
jgi:hypothetical protein